MRRAHYLQHVPFEGPAALADWLVERRWALTSTRAYLGESLPALDGIDFVFVLGGPMSVSEEQELPWIEREKSFVAEAIRREVPLLGVCLGAQLMAAALGAGVVAADQPEIGWHPVEGLPAPAPAFRFPDRFLALHWHGETFELPEGAHRLASTPSCRNQAFQVGPCAIGVQFHLEATRASLEEMIQHGEDGLVAAPWVQDAARMRGVDDAHFRDLHERMATLLEYVLRDVH